MSGGKSPLYNPQPLPESEQYRIIHPKGHYWDWCGMCGSMVRCGTCGMNTCSGGHGELADGTECPDCDSAYDIEDPDSEGLTAEQEHARYEFLSDKIDEMQRTLYSRNALKAMAQSLDKNWHHGDEMAANYEQAVADIFQFADDCHEARQKECMELLDKFCTDDGDDDDKKEGGS